MAARRGQPYASTPGRGPTCLPQRTHIRHPLLNIYLVEDSPVIRENLIATLEELVPAQVVGTAVDEAAAVAWLANPSHPVGLVIVDLFLKQGSGLGVLRAAQALNRPHQLVVLSNFATPAMRRECLALGANGVFDKSNEIEALIAHCVTLSEQLDGQRGQPAKP